VKLPLLRELAVTLGLDLHYDVLLLGDFVLELGVVRQIVDFVHHFHKVADFIEIDLERLDIRSEWCESPLIFKVNDSLLLLLVIEIALRPFRRDRRSVVMALLVSGLFKLLQLVLELLEYFGFLGLSLDLLFKLLYLLLLSMFLRFYCLPWPLRFEVLQIYILRIVAVHTALD